MTRQSSHFNMVGYRTVLCKNGISAQGPRLWNSLPKCLQKVHSTGIAIFKRELVNSFTNKYKDALSMLVDD